MTSVCYDCKAKQKDVKSRQCDYLLCDSCENKRQNSTKSDDTCDKPPLQPDQSKNTSSANGGGLARYVDSLTSSKCASSTCTHSPDSNLTKCKCSICLQEFHLLCVGLKKRPAQKTLWSCPRCKTDTNASLKTLSHTISSLQQIVADLSEKQQKLIDQQGVIVKENTELKREVLKLKSNHEKINKDHHALKISNESLLKEMAVIKKELKNYKERRDVDEGLWYGTSDVSDNEPDIIPTRTLIIGDSMLRDITDKDFKDAHVKSISGATVLDILQELNCCDDVSMYRNIVIHCGTNDVSNKTPTKSITECMEAAITFIQVTSPSTKIHISAICPRDNKKLNQEVDSVNRELNNIANKLDCGFIDTGLNMIYRNGDIDSSQFADGLHFSERGNATFLRSMENIPDLERDHNRWSLVTSRNASKRANKRYDHHGESKERDIRHHQHDQRRDETFRNSRSTRRYDDVSNSRDGNRGRRNYSGCYNCGLFNHNQDTCHYTKRLRCHKCNHLGHKASFCKNANRYY